MFDDTFGKTGFALRLLRVRWWGMRISQKAFSERFGIPSGTLRDAEQMRGKPSACLRVLVEAIALDPALIERAAKAAAEPDRT